MILQVGKLFHPDFFFPKDPGNTARVALVGPGYSQTIGKTP